MDTFWLRWFDSIPETHDPDATYEIGALIKIRHDSGWDIYVCMQRIAELNRNIPLTDGAYWLMYGARHESGDCIISKPDEPQSITEESKTVNDYHTLNAVQKFFRRLFCRHRDLEFVRNIHGEEIVARGWKRSEWRCKHCDTYLFKPGLGKL